jgi:hypothetical protein
MHLKRADLSYSHDPEGTVMMLTSCHVTCRAVATGEVYDGSRNFKFTVGNGEVCSRRRASCSQCGLSPTLKFPMAVVAAFFARRGLVRVITECFAGQQVAAAHPSRACRQTGSGPAT